MKRKDLASLPLRNWNFFLSLLPKGWQRQARQQKALQRQRKIRSAPVLLHMILLNVLHFSLQEVCWQARRQRWASLAAASLFHRLRRSVRWLEWMVEKLWQEQAPQVTPTRKGRKAKVFDASTASGPGSDGTDFRLHLACAPDSLCITQVLLTDRRVGESFCHFNIEEGDICIADRCYCTARGIAHVKRGKGDVVARYHFQTLKLYARPDVPLALPSRVREVHSGQLGQVEAWVRGPDREWTPGRLVILKLNREQTRRAHRRQRRKAQKSGRRWVSWQAKLYAGYVLLFTTLDASWSAEEIAALYRVRWQVELVFKRLKSIVGLGRLPKTEPESAKAWLYGKLLLYLVLEKYARRLDRRRPIVLPPHRQRSVWKETKWLYAAVQLAIVPLIDLAHLGRDWVEIVLYLAETIKKLS